MLPGMKHRIKIWPSNRNGQTIVRPTRFGDQGVVGNIDPVIPKADSIVAVLRFPINIADSKAVRERTAQPFARCEMVEPAIEFGTAGVVAERGSAEQEQDQDNPHRRASLLSYLLRGPQHGLSLFPSTRIA
jgi:hypothetical protein